MLPPHEVTLNSTLCRSFTCGIETVEYIVYIHRLQVTKTMHTNFLLFTYLYHMEVMIQLLLSY